jgi:hypothetical protein
MSVLSWATVNAWLIDHGIHILVIAVVRLE